MAAATAIDFSALTDEEKAELRWRLEKRIEYAAASEEDRRKIEERSRLQADFTAFAKAAWPILEPGNKLSWSWHYDLIAEYLTLAAERKIKRLIINIPPRTLKSILINVMFPVWVWTRNPAESFSNASYAEKLSTEHSVKRRDLIESDWFKRVWGGKVWLARDQNEKTKYKNNYKAQMLATSVGGTSTGLGGNFLIVDDSLKPDEIGSEAAITKLHSWFDDTWRSRLNNPAEDVMIIVEQRTGDLDLTGHCLDGDKILIAQHKNPEWTHLCIPLEADEDSVDKQTLMQRYVFPISGKIYDRPLGDVIQPDRFPSDVVSAKKILRLVWATQYQGRPSPLEGNMIKRSEVQYYGGRDPVTGQIDPVLPAKFDVIITSADCTFKDEATSDYVAVGTFGVTGSARVVLEIVNKHLDEEATETEILRQQLKWKSSVVLIEDKANGSSVIKKIKRKITGVIAVDPKGGKFSRMFSSCGEWQAGNWYVDRNAAWCEPFIEQLTKFPGAKNDDMVDCMTQTCVYIQSQSFLFGMTEWLKARDSEMKQEARKNQQEAPKRGRPPKAKEDVSVAEVVAAPAIIGQKVDHPQGLAKPDVDDSTPRCDNCDSTLLVRIAGGTRCQNCGKQVHGTAFVSPNQGRTSLAMAGMFRK